MKFSLDKTKIYLEGKQGDKNRKMVKITKRVTSPFLLFFTYYLD
jgi:hypothetical protein